MEPHFSIIQNTFLTYMTSLILPVAAFVLWSDYFERNLLQLTIKRPLYEREPELEKVRWAGFFSHVIQFVIYLEFSDLLKYEETQYIFIVSFLIQLFFQNKTEKKIRSSGVPEINLWNIIVSSFYLVFGGIFYTLILGIGIHCSLLFCYWIHASQIISVGALMVSGSIGIMGGLILNLVMVPFFIRKNLPVSDQVDPILRSHIDKFFKENKLFTPRLVVLELEDFSLFHVLILGVHFLFFRKTLFLSRKVLNSLSFQEVEILILNQISHVKLNHNRNRFLVCFFLFSITMILCIISLLLAGHSLSDPEYVSTVAILGSFFVCFCSFNLFSFQTKSQQRSADFYCIEKLGVEKNKLIQVLIRLDDIELKKYKQPFLVSLEMLKRIEFIENSTFTHHSYFNSSFKDRLKENKNESKNQKVA